MKITLEENAYKEGIFMVRLSGSEGISAAFFYEGPIGRQSHYLIYDSRMGFERINEIAHSQREARDLALQYAREYLQKRNKDLGGDLEIEDRTFQSKTEEDPGEAQSSPLCTRHQRDEGPDCPGGRSGGAATLHFI